MSQETRKNLLIGGLVFALIIFIAVIFIRGAKTDTDKLGAGKFQCGQEYVDGDNTYKTVAIGDQCWMAENLRVTTYRDGKEISGLEIYGDWAEDKEGAWACCNNKEHLCESHGAVYNYYAVVSIHGLCPKGWRVPSDEQWTEMERTICMELGNDNCEEKFPHDGDRVWRGTNEGLHLRSKDDEGEDTFGFTAQLSGSRNTNGPFSGFEEKGFWWTTTELSETSAMARTIEKDREGIRSISSRKNSGMSVRCVLE
jgi:uncharacterized protein (TIGR02145 family)